jgi:hypothetical protein
MSAKALIPTLMIIVCATLMCACAAAPKSAPIAGTTAAETPSAQRPAPPPGQTRYQWSKATDADVAAQLDKKFAAAAKSYVQLKRDDQLMFCKKYREMGSSIRTLHCITEAELRKQVEDSDQLREQMRHRMGKCDIYSGCGAGG